MLKEKRLLKLLAPRLAVCRLGPGAALPSWALSGTFCSVTRAPGELSVICPEEELPALPVKEGAAGFPAAGGPDSLRVERGFRAFQVEGPLDFELTGVLAGLLEPLAQAGIPVLAVSTFDTDYLLVRAQRVEEAIRALGQVAEVRRGG